MKKRPYNYLLVLFICFSIIIPSSTNISGQVEYFYMTRLENSQLVNIPFRLLDFNIQHSVNDNFTIFGNLGVEYRNRRDTDFMTDSNLEDFLLDLRELYISYYFDNSEIRIGKQIHGWGSVDENSPIDNLNAYDYYYLLLGGAEKKLGAYSLAYDMQINLLGGNQQVSFVYSPMHNTSRIPINDPDYPIGLPAGSSPSEETLIFKDKTPSEFGISFKSSFDFGDISISGLDLYDRIFNLSGINIYANCEAPACSDPEEFSITPRYSYRHTKALNFGAVFLFDDFTFSFDFAEFDSEDTNTEEDFVGLPNALYVPMHPGVVEMLEWLEWFEDYDCCSVPFSEIAFKEKIKYSQLALQFEMPFENDLTLNTQYFKHELKEYSSDPLDQTCETLTNLPGFTQESCEEIEEDLGFTLDEFKPENLFIPGVGTPYAMITSEAVLLNIEKEFPDHNFTIDLNAFLDAAHGDGRLLSIEGEYDFGDGFEFSLGVTKIYGDDKIEHYNFNNMESFSSFRSRITYYF